MAEPTEEDYEDLLALIRGEGMMRGPGITTYPEGDDERNKLLHAGCLELERRGLIRRVRESSGSVLDGTGSYVIWEEEKSVFYEYSLLLSRRGKNG